MGLGLEYYAGQTPIDEDEKEGLLINTITTRSELDEFEQLNIEKAIEWTLHSRFKRETILSEDFIKSLHKRMLGNVWSWVGKHRKSEKNIGVNWTEIGIELTDLLNNTNYWIYNKTYTADEIVIRFKHGMVNIHCFLNGNGRHSRIMADIFIESVFEKEIFNWGNTNMIKPDETRKNYIKALRKADNRNIKPLIEFARI